MLQQILRSSLVGIYLHGSLSMGSYYSPKSDFDLLAVVNKQLPKSTIENLSLKIAIFANKCPTQGNLEFSIVRKQIAKQIPRPIPYELHYSAQCHEKIINGTMEYSNNQFDDDLFSHFMYVKKRGICLLGQPIQQVFGEVEWKDFMFSVLEDFYWIIEDDNLIKKPVYGVLNICRVLQLLKSENENVHSKEEGGKWALSNLPNAFFPLIQKALQNYRNNEKKVKPCN